MDAIIEENKKKASSGGARSKPRGVRMDGPKKGIRIQGGSGKQTAKESRAPKMLGRGGGGGGGLGVKGAGVQKRVSKPHPTERSRKHQHLQTRHSTAQHHTMSLRWQ